MKPKRRSKNSCRCHKLELSILSIPLAKACTVCGKSQPLDHREIFWPALRPVIEFIPRIWGSPKQMVLCSLGPLAFVALIAAGVYATWKGLELFRPATANLPRRTDIQALSSAPKVLGTLTHAGDNKARETATIPQMVAFGTSHREDENPKATGSSSARFDEPEYATIGGSGVKSRFTIDSDKSDSEHTNSLRLPIVESDGDSSVKHLDANAIAIAQRVSKAISAHAISGVKVSYVKSILYLEGEVKTQSQRLAAEKAARDIPGVKEIRSSIRVEWEINRG